MDGTTGLDPETLEALRQVYGGMAKAGEKDELAGMDARKQMLRETYGGLEGKSEAPAPEVEDVPGAVGDEGLDAGREASEAAAMPEGGEGEQLDPEMLKMLLAAMK